MKLENFTGHGAGTKSFRAIQIQAHHAIALKAALVDVVDGLDKYELADMLGSQHDEHTLRRAAEILELTKD